MSKTLYLVRHAKSSWKDTSLADYNRPLNKRGKRDAPEMGRRLAAKQIQPSLIVSSPAERAKLTALAIAASVGYSKEQIKWREEMYHANSDILLEHVKKVNNRHQSLMLVGHNPGLADFQHRLCSETINNIVTTGVVCIHLAIDSWNDVNSGQLAWYDYPKNIVL